MKTLGIFDSGIGGLTVLRQILDRGIYDRIVYFGDTARVPYGSRSRQTIIRYALQDAQFLLSKNVDEIVVACGTVSANALDVLRASLELPVTGVIDSTASCAARLTRGKIGVIGTGATVRSGVYPEKLHRLNPGAEVLTAACPLFVPLVEEGFFAFENDIVRKTCEHYLAPLRDAGVDTLVLGCTHYPLLRPFIADVMGESVTLVDQGEALAATMPKGPVPVSRTTVELYVSDGAEQFSENLRHFLDRPVHTELKQVRITSD